MSSALFHATADTHISEVDSRVWPTKYLLNSLRQRLASKVYDMIIDMIGLEDASELSADRLFLLLERPRKPEHGLWALPCPKLRLAKQHAPVAIAKGIADRFVPDEFFVQAEAMGPFLNFSINSQTYLKTSLKEILNCGCSYGTNDIGSGHRIMLDYSSPNIAKPFHAGHLRSTIIGNFLKHLYVANGFTTTSLNYLGDWGKQYGLLAVGFARYGSEEELEKDPIRHLFDVYVKINNDMRAEKERSSGSTANLPDGSIEEEEEEEIAASGQKATSAVEEEARAYFCRMEAGDAEALKLWRRFRDLSIAKYRDIYARLNIDFDIYSGESCYESAMAARIEEMQALGILEDSQGAKVVDLTDQGLGKAIIVKRDGSTIYLTRDIASAHWRFEQFDGDLEHLDYSSDQRSKKQQQQNTASIEESMHQLRMDANGTPIGVEKCLYAVAQPQEYHFRQLSAVLKKMGRSYHDQLVHVSFGMVQGMSTRKGNVVFLEDILDDAKDCMHAVMKANPAKYAQIEDPETVADTLAVSAVVIQDMSARRIKDYEFRIERVTRFEGDTGPYLQYAHSRLCSIERRAEFQLDGIAVDDLHFDLLSEPEAMDLVRVLSEYPEVVQEARLSLEPCNVVSYLMNVSRCVNVCFDRLWVMNQEKNLAMARLALFRAARHVLHNGLVILGLKPLSRM